MPSNTNLILGNLIRFSSFELIPAGSAIDKLFGGQFDYQDDGFNKSFV